MTGEIKTVPTNSIGTNLPVTVTGSGATLAYHIAGGGPNSTIILERGIEYRFELGDPLMTSHPFRIIDSIGTELGSVDTTGVTVTFPLL